MKLPIKIKKILLLSILLSVYSSVLSASGVMGFLGETFFGSKPDKQQQVPLESLDKQMEKAKKHFSKIGIWYTKLPSLYEVTQKPEIKAATKDFEAHMAEGTDQELQEKIDTIKTLTLGELTSRDEKISKQIQALREIQVVIGAMRFTSSAVVGDQQAIRQAAAQNKLLNDSVDSLIHNLEGAREEISDKQRKAETYAYETAWKRVEAAQQKHRNEGIAKVKEEISRGITESLPEGADAARRIKFYAAQVAKGIGAAIPGDELCIGWLSRMLGGAMDEVGLKSQKTLEMVGEATANEMRTAAREAGNTFQRSMQRTTNQAVDNLNRGLDRAVGGAVDNVRQEMMTAVNDVGGKAVVVGTAGLASMGAVTVGVFAGYKGVSLAMRMLEDRLRKPSIIEDTNIPGFNERLKNKLHGMFGGVQVKDRVYPLLSDVVLDAETAQEFSTLKFAINNVKKNKSILRNLLLWGTPGTGKTMSARALANEIDCYWVLMTGSSLFKMAADQALQEIDALFKFAEGQDKPVMIIFDEADTLFRSRTENLSEGTLKVMTHIMHKMGTESDKTIIVAITNQPTIFDEAMRSRFPKQMEVKLPGIEQRVGILKKYIDREFIQRHVDASIFDDEFIQWVAMETKGFSGRSLMFLIAGIRDAFASSGLPQLTQDLVRPLVIKELEARAQEAAGFQRNTVVS